MTWQEVLHQNELGYVAKGDRINSAQIYKKYTNKYTSRMTLRDQKKNYKMPSQIHQIVNSGKFRKESQEYLNRNESEQLETIKMFI